MISNKAKSIVYILIILDILHMFISHYCPIKLFAIFDPDITYFGLNIHVVSLDVQLDVIIADETSNVQSDRLLQQELL